MNSDIRKTDGIEYELIRSSRKTLGITVNSGALVIVHAPKRMSIAEIARLVSGKREWILSKQAIMRKRASEKREHTYKDGDTFFIFGEQVRMEFGEVSNISINGGKLLVPSGYFSDCKAKLEAWLKKTAKAYFVERMLELSNVTGLSYTGVKLSSASKRWGSCSIKGSVCLSWRLVMAPPYIIDYVMLHELCHTREMNHSAAFWRLVAHYMPDYKQRQEWLKINYSIMEF